MEIVPVKPAEAAEAAEAAKPVNQVPVVMRPQREENRGMNRLFKFIKRGRQSESAQLSKKKDTINERVEILESNVQQIGDTLDERVEILESNVKQIGDKLV